MLKEALIKMGLDPSEEMLGRFDGYMKGILSWNDKVNLTSITDPEEFHVKHFLDSLMAANCPGYASARRIIDVGTGGGFPGVPLAIISPEKNFVLMDSLRKRLKIIDELTAELGISNVATVHARAEELARQKEHREAYDLCVTRAVANLSTLSEYCLPFVRTGGQLIAYKGPEAEQEAKDAAKAVKILGGEIREIRDAELSGCDLSHKLIIIEKVKNTPDKYPRKAGTPQKAPIR